MTEEKKRAVIYLRSAQANDEAIRVQRDLCQRTAEALGVTVAGEYMDNGGSGLDLNRPGLHAMLDRLKNGGVNYFPRIKGGSS